MAQPKAVNVGVVNKKTLSLPKPQIANLNHPKHFRINEEQIVAVQIVIDENGKVIGTNAIFGHALLRASCEYAARQAKFSPTFVNGPRILVNALLIYKFKPDGTIETDIEKDDEMVLGKIVDFVEPPVPFCNCRLGGNIQVEVEVDGQGNVTKAKVISGHPLLRTTSEHAARFLKFLPINLKTKLIISYNFTVADRSSVKFSSVETKNVRILK